MEATRILSSYPFFVGKDFARYRQEMEWSLMDDDLLAIVDGSETLEDQTTGAERKSFGKRERKAYAKIGKSLDVAHRSIIAGAGTAPDAWRKLVGHFDRKDELNLIELKCAFYSVVYTMDRTMLQHTTDVMNLASRLRARLGSDNPSDLDIIAVLINSVSSCPAYSTVCLVLKMKEALGLDELLERFEQRATDILKEDAAEANLVSVKYKCRKCHKQGHFQRDCPLNKNRTSKRTPASVAKSAVRKQYDDEAGYETACAEAHVCCSKGTFWHRKR